MIVTMPRNARRWGRRLWLSLGAHLVIAFFPVLLASNFATASAVTCGLMLGYLWYISIHHILHHWHPRHPGHFYTLKRRHALHHHVDETINFGVTSAFWDRLFGTARLSFSDSEIRMSSISRALRISKIEGLRNLRHPQ